MPKKSLPRPQPTHFLCLPLLTPASTPQLAQSLADFRSIASRKSKAGDSENTVPFRPVFDVSIPDAAYRPLGTLHLTLGVMALPTEERLEAVISLLSSLGLQEMLQDAEPAPPGQGSVPNSQPGGDSRVDEIQTLKRAITPPPLSQSHKTSPKPLKISLEGLSAFPDESKATVLHAPPHDPTKRLHNFCLALRQAFIDAHFIAPENRALVLHATIVNTVYAKRASERRGEGMKRGLGKISMDVRQLAAWFDGRHDPRGFQDEAPPKYLWAGDVEIDRVRICKMGARKVEDELLGQEYEVVEEKMVLPNET